MSYDLMVFDPAAAPDDRAAFMAWYWKQVEWSESHSYNDDAVTTPQLRAWYRDMKQTWFPMNGPDSPFRDLADDSPLWDDLHGTDYSIGHHCVYCCFRWDLAEAAHEAVTSLAKQHKVGFFDVSAAQGKIVFPEGPEL